MPTNGFLMNQGYTMVGRWRAMLKSAHGTLALRVTTLEGSAWPHCEELIFDNLNSSVTEHLAGGARAGHSELTVRARWADAPATTRRTCRSVWRSHVESKRRAWFDDGALMDRLRRPRSEVPGLGLPRRAKWAYLPPDSRRAIHLRRYSAATYATAVCKRVSCARFSTRG